MPEIVLIIVVVFAAVFARAILGFGDALLAMPFLTILIGIKTATPLVAFICFTTTSIMFASHRQHVDIKSAWKMTFASLFGIPVGLFWLKSGPDFLLKAALGIILIIFSFWSLMQFKPKRTCQKDWSFLFGFVGGILGGAYNSNGPPAVIYGVLRRWPPNRFRATLQGYFLPSGLIVLAGHGLAGLWTKEVFKLYVLSLPVIIAAMIAGKLASSLLPRQWFHILVNVSLMMTGILLLL